MVPQCSHLKQLRWKNLPSALSRSITYTRLWQKKQTSLPPTLVGNSFLREPWGRATERPGFNIGKSGNEREKGRQDSSASRCLTAVRARGHSS